MYEAALALSVVCLLVVLGYFARSSSLSIFHPQIFNTYGPHMHSNEGRAVSNFIVQPLPQDDPRQRQPNIARAKADLSWYVLGSEVDANNGATVTPRGSV